MFMAETYSAALKSRYTIILKEEHSKSNSPTFSFCPFFCKIDATSIPSVSSLGEIKLPLLATVFMYAIDSRNKG